MLQGRIESKASWIVPPCFFKAFDTCSSIDCCAPATDSASRSPTSANIRDKMNCNPGSSPLVKFQHVLMEHHHINFSRGPFCTKLGIRRRDSKRSRCCPSVWHHMPMDFAKLSFMM